MKIVIITVALLSWVGGMLTWNLISNIKEKLNGEDKNSKPTPIQK